MKINTCLLQNVTLPLVSDSQIRTGALSAMLRKRSSLSRSAASALLTLADIREQAEESDLRALVVAHGHAGNADPYRRSIDAAQAKIEGPAVAGQRAKKIALRIGQVIRIDARKAGLFGHRFEVGPQNLSHAPVAEDGPAFRIDDPYAFRYGLDEPAIHLDADVHDLGSDLGTWK